MSSVFNSAVEPKHKPMTRHPWERIIKPGLENKIRHVHNSINNPVYPKIPKEKGKNPLEPDKRARFQVIGDMFSDEFVFCSKIVNGLYKYRWKKFGPPIIRGVTSVDWPRVLNEIRHTFGSEAYCTQRRTVVIFNNKYLGGLEELKELVATKYIYYLMYDNKNAVIHEFKKFVKSTGRPCVYMHISVNDTHIGTMIFSLYADIVPLTCENFMRRCKERRGGYSGTPVHRIVKDSWIQCGGFALKPSELACENFIVQFDKRGVIAMANDGRDIDCSRQFFITLQPQEWMQYNYVAFGQLIDGEDTLKMIEKRPCWHESPTEEIIIYQAGIMNLDCPNILINPHANQYLELHIENLFALGNLFLEELMEMFDDAINFREELREIIMENFNYELDKTDMSESEFMLKYKSRSVIQVDSSPEESANQDFDVEDYIYEPEQYAVSKISAPPSTIHHEPIKKHYIPFTDVPYPDEVDSTYDMKKFLKGDYCLESDLHPAQGKSLVTIFKMQSFSSELFQFDSKMDEEFSFTFRESEELKHYMKNNLDRVSFAGDIIMGISRGYAKINIFENVNKSEIVNLADEDLRRLRKVFINEPDSEIEHRPIKRRQTGFVHPEQFEELLRVRESSLKEDKLKEPDDDTTEEPAPLPSAITKSLSRLGFNAHVKLSVEENSTTHDERKRIRRPTAFVHSSTYDSDDDEKCDDKRKATFATNTGLKNFRRISDQEKDDGRAVRIDSKTLKPTLSNPDIRRLTNYPDNDQIEAEELEGEKEYIPRKDTLDKLPRVTDEAPTLKDYKPQNQLQIADLFVRELSAQRPGKLQRDSQPEKGEYQYLRPSLTVEDVIEFRSKKKGSRPSIEDSVIALRRPKTHSLRSYEYAKQRPTLTVSEYKMKNLIKSLVKPPRVDSDKGIRLPGDTPLYSPTSSVGTIPLIFHSLPGRRSLPARSSKSPPPPRASVQKSSNSVLPVLSEEIQIEERLRSSE